MTDQDRGDSTAHGFLSQRIDVWLVNSRLVKTRSLAASLVSRGKVRINRARAEKPASAVKVGDVLTLSLGPRIRVVEVAGFAVRRGPASVSASLYRQLTPAPEQTKSSPPGNACLGAAASAMVVAAVQGGRAPGAGRPTKRDRRAIAKLKSGFEN